MKRFYLFKGRMKDMRNEKSLTEKNTPSNIRNKFVVRDSDPLELLVFLTHRLSPQSKKSVKELLARGHILVEDRITRKYDHPLRPGDQIVIIKKSPVYRKTLPAMDILFEDEYLIVINKKEGLLCVSTNSEKKLTAYGILSQYVKQKNPRNRIFVLHRLDRETSGVMMFAKSEKIQAQLQARWNESIIERSYTAIVEGKVEKKEGTITSWLKENQGLVVYSSPIPGDGEKAITHFKRLQYGKGYSLLEVHLETGKKNQIRVHMTEMGHPIAGDRKYGSTTNPLGRLGLHATCLAFNHPATGQTMHFSAPLPPAYRKLFNEK